VNPTIGAILEEMLDSTESPFISGHIEDDNGV
jgi:hypothetical protein